MQAFEINGKHHLSVKHVLLRFLTAPFVFLVGRLFQNIVRLKSLSAFHFSFLHVLKRFARLKIYALMLLFALGLYASAQTVILHNTFEQPPQGGFGSFGATPQINASNNGIIRFSNFSSGTMNSSWPTHINAGNSYYDMRQWNTTLSSHTDGTLVIWYFNFRKDQGNANAPGGITGSREGIAVVLASNASIGGGTDNIYAVTYGDAANVSTTNGLFQLVRKGGADVWTARTVITGSASALHTTLGGGATANGYYSCKVVYNPQTDAWSLFARFDGTGAFKDPLDPTSAYTLIGSENVVDATYTTTAGSGANSGIVNNFSASNRFNEFDNFYVFNGIGNGAAAGSQLSVVGPRNQSSPTVPVLSGITGGPGTSNGEQFYYVFGHGLGSDITVTAPSGLEIGTSPAGSFSSSLVLARTNSQVGAKIYVRPTGTTAVSNTISHAASGATTKTLTVDQAAAGPIQATGVTINANDPSQALNVTFQNAGTTITGRWNPFQDQRAVPPTANMANSTTTCAFAAATTTKSYQAQSFRVSATGSYTFTMRTNGLFDGAGYIVTGAFVPGSCATGTWVSGSDNSAGAEPVITATLTAGVTYTLISQFSANVLVSNLTAGAADRSYAWDITPPAGEQILIPHVTCGNLIANYWNGNGTGGATQVQDYGLRNTTMNNSTTCLFTASTNHNYSYNDFQVSADGLYTFTMKSNSGYDGHGYIVRHSTGAGAPPYTPSPFAFSTCPGNGAFIQGDDANGEATITNVQLYAGVTYTLVSSAKGPELANNGTVAGAFSWSVSGAGNLLTKVDGMLQWYTAASGGSPVGYGGSFDPVFEGVLANTATPGTYTYYVAFGGYPNTRTAVDFVISAPSCNTGESIAAGNWSNTATWCGGSVPTSGNVVIDHDVNFDNATITLTDLTINSGNTLTIAAGKELTINGTLTNNGTLTLENGATLVQGTSSTATTASGNGYVVKQVVSGSGGSTPNGRGWYIGSPVSGATSNVFNPQNSTDLLYHWSANQTTPAWAQISAGSGTALEVGKGYLIRMGAASTTLNFSSNTLNNGAINIPCYRQASATFQGYNLISNPYPSYLNWASIYAANSSSFEDKIWYRIGNASNAMVFDTYAGGVGTNNYGGQPVSGHIPPMQAVWVRLNSSITPGTSPTNLTLSNDMRSHYAGGAGAGLKSTIQDLPMFVRLNLLQDNKKDQVLVYMRPEAQNLIDAYDAEKMFLTNYPQIYTKINDKKLVINAMKNNKTQTLVRLFLELPSAGVYTLNTEEFNIENGLILLEDKQEGVIQDMTLNENYLFYGNAGVLANRFFIHFILPDPVITATGPSNNWVDSENEHEWSEILISTNGKGKILVSQNIEQTDNVKSFIAITDALGKLVLKDEFVGANGEFDLLDVVNGVYFVRVESNGQIAVKKVLVQF